jgi:hypothetical protein
VSSKPVESAGRAADERPPHRFVAGDVTRQLMCDADPPGDARQMV